MFVLLDFKTQIPRPQTPVFALPDIQHIFQRQRLEVQPVTGVVVGRDGFGVAVDHNRLVAKVAQGHAGMHAAVVELDALADAVRPAAQDHDFGLAGDLGLVDGGVGAVHIGRVRLELGRASVDAVVHRDDAERFAARAHIHLCGGREVGGWGMGIGRPTTDHRRQAWPVVDYL
ncbi:hypothetical protein SE17_14635 [Kouleothrix aurantiaca]|uniref:Uncharacterized protein n=1 Tax=Kouleothrix aurantiaca TaxID=186479 RepID=A0A0P9DAB3_9CHLR|nr:hypothetical protein SE17_14635 [Kouleothrix aurantiaca]